MALNVAWLNKAADAFTHFKAAGSIGGKAKVAGKAAREASTFAGKKAWGGLAAVGKSFKQDYQGSQALFTSLSSSGKFNQFEAGLKAFGTTKNLMLAGAGIGFFAGGPDHRMRGMTLGAAGGAAVKGATNVFFANKLLEDAPLARSFLKVGFGAAVVGGAGIVGMKTNQPVVEASAHYNAQSGGGYQISAGRGEDDAVYAGSSVRERQSLMQATGRRVLGAHALRHG